MPDTSVDPLQLIAVLCVTLTGILFVVGARKQAGKTFAAAMMVCIADVLIPKMWSAAFGGVRSAPLWLEIAAAPFVVLFIVFATIRIFQAVIARIYGRYVSVRLTASALGNTFYWIGRGLWFVVTLPVRLFARRPSIDEILRDWRHE